MTTTRRINKQIREAHASNRYVYLVQGPTAVRRIIDAKTRDGRVCVKSLSTGSWIPVISADTIEIR